MYTIRPILKMILFSLPAAGGLLFCFHILLQTQALNAKERMRRCVKALPLVLIVSLLGGAGCMAYLQAGVPYSGNFKISYTYPKASKGLAPNGTALDVNEILSDEVLTAAIETGTFGTLTTDDIRNTLNIRNVKQRSSVSVDTLYVSTEYRVSYQASERTQSLDKNAILKAVADSYYDYFVSKYARKTDILEDDYADLSEMDYLDVNTYLYQRINAVIDYVDMCRSENSTFVSESTTESFDSIRDKARNFRDVALERYKAYVLKYGISRDSGQYISRLNYENRLENMDYMKNLAAYQVRLAAIERYEGDITRAVLVPTRDENGEFYQSRTKIGTDYFANEADKHLDYATTNQLHIETNNYYIECLLAAAGEASHRQKADEMIESLKNEILAISLQAKETVEDFDAQTTNGYISFAFAEDAADWRSDLKKTAMYVAASCGAWLAAVYTGTGQKKREKIRRKKAAPHPQEG